MKKVLTTILALVYLSSSTGATIHLHYCMGRLASWGLFDHESNKCLQCGMAKKTTGPQGITAKAGCCRDEHKQIKTDKDQKLSPSGFFKYNNLSQAFAQYKPDIQSIKAISVAIEYPNINAPPLLGKLPLFVLYRNLRL